MRSLCTLLLTSIGVFAGTIDRPVPVNDNDAALKNLVNTIGLQSVNDQIRDTVWWVPATKNYDATRIITAQNGDRHFTWQFNVKAQRSTCKRASVTFSKVSNCTPDKTSPQTKQCSVYISYWEKRRDQTLDSETYCN